MSSKILIIFISRVNQFKTLSSRYCHRYASQTFIILLDSYEISVLLITENELYLLQAKLRLCRIQGTIYWWWDYTKWRGNDGFQQYPKQILHGTPRIPRRACSLCHTKKMLKCSSISINVVKKVVGTAITFSVVIFMFFILQSEINP